MDSRKLQETLLEKERQKFRFGISQVSDVVAAQSALVAAQLSELNTLASYNRARIALTQVVGDTLKVNHVSLDDALAGTGAGAALTPDGDSRLMAQLEREFTSLQPLRSHVPVAASAAGFR